MIDTYKIMKTIGNVVFVVGTPLLDSLEDFDLVADQIEAVAVANSGKMIAYHDKESWSLAELNDDGFLSFVGFRMLDDETQSIVDNDKELSHV